MKLLFLDQYSDLGGAQKDLLELLPAVRHAGWQAVVGLPGSGPLFEKVRALGFDAESIDCGPYHSIQKSVADFGRFLAGTPRLAMQIRRMFQRLPADVVILNGPRLLPAAAFAGLGSQPGPAVIFHSHSYLPRGPVRSASGLSLKWMDAWVVGQCGFVIAPWRPFTRPERSTIIYSGVAGPVRTLSRSPAGPPRVGCIGRIAPEKGQREFVSAARRIHAALPECRFVIHGSPLFGDRASTEYAQQVHALAEGLPLEFAGWTDDVYASMSQLDLLLVPSAGHEATTRVILEAFSAGLPVISFRSGGIPEVIEDGITGVLTDSSETMAERAIELLTGDVRRLISIARQARESWERRFTLEGYHRQMLRLIQAAAGRAALPANHN